MNDDIKVIPIEHILFDGLVQKTKSPQQLWPNTKVIILTIFWETVEPNIWLPHLEHLLKWIKSQPRQQKIFLALNIWYKNWDLSNILSDVQDIVFVDFFLLNIWMRLDRYQLIPKNQQWNQNSDKFLFLVGKPYKYHRIRLLWKLSQTRALEQADWSFYVDDKYHSHCHKFIPELSVDDYQKFLVKYQHRIDIDKSQIGRKPLAGVANLYCDYSFGVISETNFDRLYSFPWITEKTWIHIANRLPFILVGEHNSSKLLNNLGINTYNQQLAIPNFDQPDSPNYLTPKKYWLEHVKKIDGWKKFYQEIKDLTWPDDDLLSDKDLHILKEIKNTYTEPIRLDSERRIDCAITNILYWTNTSEWKKGADNIIDANYKKYLILAESANDDLQSWLNDCKINLSTSDLILNKEASSWKIQKNYRVVG